MNIFAFERQKETISIRNIRPSRYIYYMAYVLELIFFSVRGNFLPVSTKVFGINGWTIIFAAHMIASLIVMLMWTKKFKPLLIASLLIMLAGLVPYIFLPVGILRFVFGLIGYIGLGGVVTGARCGYAFAANNAERLFGIILMFFSVTMVRLANSLGADGIFVTVMLPIALLVVLSFCIVRFREEDLEVKEESSKEDARGVYWALAFFIVYFSVDGYIGELTESSRNEYMYLIAGSLLAVVILVSAFCKIRFSTWHLWNLFLLFSIAMGVFAVLAPKIGTDVPMNFFGGLSYIGWPLCIYTLGSAQRRFASYRLLKKCTLVYVLLSPFTTLSSDWASNFYSEYFPMITLIYILTISFVLLMFSPVSYQYLFSSLWIDGLYKSDMTALHEKVEQADQFGKYELTPRQKEVAALLLAAKTRRQIAGELGLSESTVKMHTSELYKRLNINSKAELFKIFGVTATEESPEE